MHHLSFFRLPIKDAASALLPKLSRRGRYDVKDRQAPSSATLDPEERPDAGKRNSSPSDQGPKNNVNKIPPSCDRSISPLDENVKKNPDGNGRPN